MLVQKVEDFPDSVASVWDLVTVKSGLRVDRVQGVKAWDAMAVVVPLMLRKKNARLRMALEKGKFNGYLPVELWNSAMRHVCQYWI